MSGSERIAVRVAGVKLTIPVYKSPEFTEAIAARVEERLQEIEASSRRIDSHAFALQAALEFAIECQARQDQGEEEARELAKALARAASAIRAAAADLNPDA